MQVDAHSPIDKSKQPYLAAWDACARKYFNWFELRKMAASDNLHALQAQSPVNVRSRYQELDQLALRQQLGSISNAEVAEVNRVCSGTFQYICHANNEPAKLVTYDLRTLAFFIGGGGAFGFYGKFVCGFNWLWLGAAVIPMAGGLLLNGRWQDEDAKLNAYRYLLSKRATACEMEANAARVKDREQVRALLNSGNTTLFEVEAKVVDTIFNGKW